MYSFSFQTYGNSVEQIVTSVELLLVSFTVIDEKKKRLETMVKKALKALSDKDYKALASCFSEDCKYFDYCPSCNGKDSYFVYGSASVEMFFRNRFTFDSLTVSDPVIENDKTASFFGAYEGPYIFARFRIEELDDAGLIKKAVVSPA